MKTIFLLIIILIHSFYNFSQDVPKKNNENKSYVSLAGKMKGSISKEEILNAKSLVVNKELVSSYHVASFKMTLFCKSRNPVEFDNDKNGDLSLMMIQNIKEAEPGCKIFFEYIKLVDNKNSNESLKHSTPLSFVLN